MADTISRYNLLWPLIAPFRAVPTLLNANGTDLAASLAFFTVLSQLPFVALMAMLLIAIGPSDGVVEVFTEALHYLFPASRDLIDDAINSLLGGSLTIGILAVVNLMIGANRLFAATTRAVNRVFGVRNTKVVQVTIKSVSLATVVVALFMLSMGLSGVIQALIRLSQDSATVTHGLSGVATIILGAVATIIPAILTTVIFTVIYYRIPNIRVQLQDAIFGAIVAIILFEAGKHIFFWFNSLDTTQANIYGPITSVVVLMLWAYIACFIFLYGAAIAKTAADIRAK
ncbi:MAG: YihY/virulence factor BrkB family protein [Chloroflexi bacterium]|nr:YihY/virulence factor BrkB family protein [Chloroflexota bacterium]